MVDSAKDKVPEAKWNESLETYLCDTAEKAECLSWVHKRSEELYSHRTTFIDMPVIVLSSLVGFCSVGSSTIFYGRPELSNILLGTVSLFVSLLNTTGSYFGWAKRAEGHRVSSISFSKLYRFLKVELSLPRHERMSPNSLLKYCKDQYDRLQEVSPLIPKLVADEFKRKFSKYSAISKPEEMNGLSSVIAFDHNPKSNPPVHVIEEVSSSLDSRRPSAFSVEVPVYYASLTKTDSKQNPEQKVAQ